MANCPVDGTELTSLPGANKGAGEMYVCTACKAHYYGQTGNLFRTAYVKGGTATIAAASTLTVTVSHGLQILPVAGDITLNLGGALTNAKSGQSFYISAYSSQNFVITTDVAGGITSGTTFVWKYSSM
jgi:hypothetical protein